jgi:hypothetical protein
MSINKQCVTLHIGFVLRVSRDNANETKAHYINQLVLIYLLSRGITQLLISTCRTLRCLVD